MISAAHVASDVTILASAVVVLGGLIALTRGLLHFRDTVRDNTTATDMLSQRIKELSARLDRDYGELADRVAKLERRR
jgi:hypothetical protein